ncbi:MAG TPA: hypothetical protein VIJ75_14520 [Hanamia sp.]
MYNRAVNHINTAEINNNYVYNTNVNGNNRNNRSSYNGRGGIMATPTRQQQTAARENHVQATPAQLAQISDARTNKRHFASVNHGHPGILVQPTIKNDRAVRGNQIRTNQQQVNASNQRKQAQANHQQQRQQHGQGGDKKNLKR